MKTNYLKNAKLMLAFMALSVTILSCAGKRDLVYFSNLNKTNFVPEALGQEVLIGTGDILNVSVFSASLESNKLFQTNGNNATPNSGYKVNEAGNIYLPLIGEFHIAG